MLNRGERIDVHKEWVIDKCGGEYPIVFPISNFLTNQIIIIRRRIRVLFLLSVTHGPLLFHGLGGWGQKYTKHVCDISLREHTHITTLAKLQFLNRTSYCGLDSLLTRIDLLFGDHLCVEHGSCWSSQKHDPITYSPKEQIQAHKRYNSWQETWAGEWTQPPLDGWVHSGCEGE